MSSIIGGEALARAVEAAYQAGQTDYYLEPLALVDGNGAPVGKIKDGDQVVFCCRRGEREIELTDDFVDPAFPHFERDYMKDLSFVIMTMYHEKFKDLPIAFAPEKVVKPLAQVIGEAGLRQFHCAESEKYAHVTFFFNGGENQPFPGEDDLRVPSPKGIPFDQKPELSLPEVAEKVMGAVDSGYEFILTNFANGDVIGHTANTEAKLSAAATVNQVFFVVQQFALSIGNALVALAAQYWGQNRPGPVRTLTGIALKLGVILSVALVAVCALFPEPLLYLFTDSAAIVAEGTKYLSLLQWTFALFILTNVLMAALRSVGIVNISFYVSVVSLLVNVGINYTLIFGRFGFPELGILGAAVGTLTARTLEFLIVLAYILKVDKKLRLFSGGALLRRDPALRRDYARHVGRKPQTRSDLGALCGTAKRFPRIFIDAFMKQERNLRARIDLYARHARGQNFGVVDDKQVVRTQKIGQIVKMPVRNGVRFSVVYQKPRAVARLDGGLSYLLFGQVVIKIAFIHFYRPHRKTIVVPPPCSTARRPNA